MCKQLSLLKGVIVALLISIEPENEIPIYVQLRNQIINALVAGELKEGDSLPSVRQLASELGVNLHTVNKAYKVLEDEGYVRIHGRRGAVISAQPKYTKSYLIALEENIKHLFIEARSQGVEKTLFRQIVEESLSEEEHSEESHFDRSPEEKGE